VSNKLWSGRFSKPTAKAVEEFTESVSVDARMVAEDIWGSEAHAIMLAAQGIIGEDDLRVILRGLERARELHEAGKLKLRQDREDVHMNVESYLIEEAGIEFGGKLHTGRSRNDQVATDARMRMRVEILDTQEALLHLQAALLELATGNEATLFPGFTHVQHAQPITLGFWATAHASVLARDFERLSGAYDRVNRCPLGAAALAGSSFPLDRKLTAKLLGFDSVLEHALDCVSSRDHTLETLSALAICASNLSKLAEELVLWSTSEFGLVTLDDAYASGSSIMPQKKNPDVPELVRGRTGRLYGALVQMLTVVKGTPLGYNRDLQEDRYLLWDAFDALRPSLHLMGDVIATARFDTDRAAELAGAEFACATELANWLVRQRGLSFRESHEIVGKLVGAVADAPDAFADAGRVAELMSQAGIEAAAAELVPLLDPARVVASYRTTGSTAPREVRRMMRALARQAERSRADVESRRSREWSARQRTQTVVRGVLAGEGLGDLLA